MATNENRPGDQTGAVEDERPGRQDVTSSLRQSVVMAAEMLSQAADRERAIFEMAWAEGYRDGFETGAEVGRGQAENAMERAWSDLAAKIRRTASTPKHAELELIRWDGRREDFGRPRPGDHPGGPKPWNGAGAGQESAA
ncbi:hypothetical protein [Actinomadura rugatobispora]|uniref:Uncharacterized protein n=1 Tax=Actinomadura rugatobispora TaxID=1994 RepID=A0ABW1AFU6_9ACTN|nr:hypothetical protein GCM10010200_072440 [Actinomadura rugatobispora]